MSLRPAVVEDAAACAGIVGAWLTQTDWMPGGGPSRDALEETIAKGIPAREFWVIGAPVQGLGKALLDAVKNGREYVQLWTHEANTQAHRFYHSEGFVTVGRCAEGRGDGIPELHMEWRA